MIGSRRINRTMNTSTNCEPIVITFPSQRNRWDTIYDLVAMSVPFVLLVVILTPVMVLTQQYWTVGTLLLLGLPISVICLAVIGPKLFSIWAHRRLLRILAQRDNPVIAPYDPEAICVRVLPKEDWWLVNNSVDWENPNRNAVVPNDGLLLADLANRQLLLESVQQRWVLPGECLREVRIINPSIGWIGVAFSFQVQHEWREVLVCVRRTRLYQSAFSTRADAEKLRTLIGHLADPTQWPTISPAITEIMHQPDD
jgi:hypothetical protein